MASLFSLLHVAAAALYGVSLTVFTVLMCASVFGGVGDLKTTMRRFQTWGPGLGLSMGALIFGGLGTYWFQNGSFSWPLDTPEQQLVAAKHAIFLVLWLSAFHLEIWTLDPVRKISSGQIEGDYDTAARKVTVQAAFNTALVWVVAGLAWA